MAVAVLAGMVRAASMAWTCDDAFISFRYAENLVHGSGLVFNAGERVEGYTNFLWTIWIALGMRFGFEPEGWSMVWGVALHGGTLALLGGRCIARARAAGARWALPVAVLAAVAHPDWCVHATSGLETSLFVFLLVAGFLVAVDGIARPGRLAAAGALFGLATLTRPDGALFALLTGAWLLLQRAARPRGVVAYGATFAAVFLPFLLWRFSYYGDWVPNTYYAKSAGIPWIEQGLVYARLYFQKYGVLLAAPVLAGTLLLTGVRSRLREASAGGWQGEVLLALVLATAHVAYVIRVGGDFMYARMLLPATPLLLIVLETAVTAWAAARPRVGVLAASAVIAALVLTPHPMPGQRTQAGIVNEREWYDASRRHGLRRKGETLRRTLDGLSVRAAFLGSEARVVFYSKVPVAIECEAGLTDRTIARQPLRARGRIGHEKRPSVSYLVAVRGVQIAFHPQFSLALGFGDSLVTMPLRIGSARCALLSRDPAFVSSLIGRGARVGAPSLHRGEESRMAEDRTAARIDARP